MKSIMQVYAAKAYTSSSPRKTAYIEVNIPEYLPTLPKDDKITNLTAPASYFVNTNYPKTKGNIKTSHSVALPLARGSSCPTIFKKGTAFILMCPSPKIEEGYLFYI